MTDATEPRRISVLVVDDEKVIRDQLKLFFEHRNRTQRTYRFDVDVCESVASGIDAMRARDYDVLVLDVIFEREGRKRGLDLALLVRRELGSDMPIRIIITAQASYPDCIEAGRSGVWDYLPKRDVEDRAFADIVVDSAVKRLRELDFRKEIESVVVEKWLPLHGHELERDYAGQIVALWHRPTVKVLASGRDEYELSDVLRSGPAPGEPGERPVFYPVPEKG